MLPREENELLTRVGPGTPLGELFRYYWVPALLSEEIPAPDCPPVRVRLLGEDLVAFRDSQGRIGLLEERCPHRRASLFFGRNEEGGLRCVYHGWKFDVGGHVLETPAEPPGSSLKHKVQHRAYPCTEAAGVVFTYMGPKEKRPPFPCYEWLSVPPGHLGMFKCFLECNYLQSLEGDCDPSHLGSLHQGSFKSGDASLWFPSSYEVMETQFGLRVVTVRHSESQGSAQKDARVSNFVMPFIGCVDVGYRDGFMAVYQTPSDDCHTTRYNFRFRISEPMPKEEIESHSREIARDQTLKGNKRNDFLIDREKQRTDSATGIPGFTTQDASMTQSMGPICDRTREHLGVGDTYVIALRRYLLRAVRALQDGKIPVNSIDPSQIRGTLT